MKRRIYVDTSVVGGCLDKEFMEPNFKHIVNLVRIQGYNSVNLRRGYPLLEIRTPKEILPL